MVWINLATWAGVMLIMSKLFPLFASFLRMGPGGGKGRGGFVPRSLYNDTFKFLYGKRLDPRCPQHIKWHHTSGMLLAYFGSVAGLVALGYDLNIANHLKICSNRLDWTKWGPDQTAMTNVSRGK
jgi:hypothetical protein